MCTLIVSWSSEGMLVGANRDEKYNRYSEDFAFRPDGICCPLDVRGGTWIGINDRFVFVAITNLEVERGDKIGRRSRGDLVFQALKQGNALSSVGKVFELLGSGNYNPFNILVADPKHLLGISYSENVVTVKKLSSDEEIHTATPWGIDVWNIKRCQDIKTADLSFDPITSMQVLLGKHGNKKENSICLHNNDYGTVSSCVMDIKWGLEFNVFHLKRPSDGYSHTKHNCWRNKFPLWNKLTLKAT